MHTPNGLQVESFFHPDPGLLDPPLTRLEQQLLVMALIGSTGAGLSLPHRSQQGKSEHSSAPGVLYPEASLLCPCNLCWDTKTLRSTVKLSPADLSSKNLGGV